MNNLKIYEKNLKKKVGAIALSVVLGVTTLGMTGCTKETKVATSDVVYTVEKTEAQKEYEKCSRIISFKPLVDNIDIVDKDFANYDRVVDLSIISDNLPNSIETNDDLFEDDSEYLKDYVYIIRDGGFVNHVFKKDKTKEFLEDGKDYDTFTTATFKGNGNFVLPNPYKWSENKFSPGASETYADEIIKLEELYGVNGNRYLHYEYIICARKDITEFDADKKYIEKYGLPEQIKEGDYIDYEAIYYVNDKNELTLLADKQTGIGSDCDNVKNEVKGNLDEVFKPISALGKDKKSQEFSDSTEFEKFVFGIEDNKSKVRK